LICDDGVLRISPGTTYTPRRWELRKPVAVGIIGAGFIGRVHAKAARVAGGHLIGVVDSDLAAAGTLVEELCSGKVFERADDLIADPDVTVVHVCVPNYLHAQVVADVLAAGKHVVCEKPLAMTSSEAKRLETLALAAGVVAATPFVYRYYPIVREIRERVRSGEGGRLSVLHGSYLQDWLASEADGNWRVDPSLGGPSRAFADIGVHWVDLIEFTSGQHITRLCAQLLTVFPSRDGPSGPIEVHTEDAVTVNFETDGGAIGSVVLSQVALGRKNRLWLSLDGTGASFVFDHEEPDCLWIGGRSTNQLLFSSPDGLHPAAAKYVTVPAGHPQGFQDCFNAFVADCYAAIAGETPDGLPGFSDGRRAAEITEAVLVSSATGTWTDVP
jgi:predicted dehydrogenase